jgi:hypothetical protein
MRIRSSLSIGLLLAGVFVVPAIATAQSVTSEQPISRQRAPGVPMAPRPTSIDPGIAARERAADPARFNRQQAQSTSRVDRDLPMPRPVPSIIAP